MKLYMLRTAGGLKPADPEAEAYVSRLKYNDLVQVEIRRPRNPQFHRKFFALLNLAFQNQERFDNFEHFREEVQMLCGSYEIRYHLHSGEKWFAPKSIAFHAMDEAEFEKLYDKAVGVILKHVFHGMARPDLEQAVLEFMGDYSA